MTASPGAGDCCSWRRWPGAWPAWARASWSAWTRRASGLRSEAPGARAARSGSPRHSFLSVGRREGHNYGEDRTMSHRRAASLVEMLVVIALIGVLIGLFLPAVGGARRRAMETVCEN